MKSVFKIALLSFILALSLLFLTVGCGDDDDDDDSGSSDDDDDDNDDDNDNDDNDDNDDDDDTPELPEFYNQFSFLSDLSLWSGHVESDNLPKASKIGEFGVGNGRVFALVGTILPYNTLRNIIGPDYDRDPKFFSDKRFNLLQFGQQQNILNQTDFRVRKTSVTLTEAQYENGLAMYTVDFAVKGGQEDDDVTERALIRYLIVKNHSDSVAGGLQISIRSLLGKVENGVYHEQVESKHLFFKPLGGQFGEKGPTLINIPELMPGQEAVATVVFAFVFDEESPDDVFNAVEQQGADTLLNQTYDWWANWYDQAAVLTTPDRKFNDMIESLQITIKVQQAFTGATCVMSEYTGTWIRDAMGPARFYTPIGRTEDVRQMLDYYYLAALERGNIANSMHANIVLDELPDPPDWENLPVMTGRTNAESPSYIPLQYYAYVLNSGDLTPIEERYGMLKHCLIHQDFREGCLLRFSGDETFREMIGLGSGYILGSTKYEDLWYSFNSMFLYVAASNAMAKMAGWLGYIDEVTFWEGTAQDIRDCAEEYFWLEDEGYYAPMIDQVTLEPIVKPFEDVNFKALWIGYSDADDPQQIENIISVKEIIGRPDGTAQTPLHPLYTFLRHFGIEEGVFTGMSQGYYLDSLSRIDHPDAQKAFEIWKVHGNDSGNVSEAMIRDNYGRVTYLIEPLGFLSDLTSRYRPWEGGIYGAALIGYLTGMHVNLPDEKVEFFPHLPLDWDQFTYESLPFGDESFGVTFTDSGSAQTFRLENGQGEFSLKLRMSAPGTISALSVNGTPANPEDYNPVSRWGRSHVTLEDLAIEAGQTLTVNLTYE